MAFEISLRLPFSLPRVLRSNSDEPQHDYHWIGQKQETPQSKADPGNPDQKPQGEKNPQEYRPLSSIKLGEVEDAIHLFAHQLIPAHENWIRKNHFCTIPLKRKKDGRPPVIFGRVKTCYPSDGHLGNIEDVELFFPRKDRTSDRVIIHKDDISQYSQKPVQSFFLQVQFKASEEDAADFDGSVALFLSNGFSPRFDSGFYDLLEMNDQNQSAYPWLYVIGSRWFDGVPDSFHAEVKAKLKEMNRWGKHIFNYHPDWLPKEVNTLNRVLGYKYEFTPALLTEPANPRETAYIVAKLFERELFPNAEVQK